MKYRQLKPISPAAILEAQGNKGNPCFQKEFESFLDWNRHYGSNNFFVILDETGFKRLCKDFSTYPQWSPWFIEHGFIKEVREEYYKVGDNFKHGGEVYRLCCVLDDMTCLIGLESSNRWHDPIKVATCEEITQGEFDLMCGNSIGKFTKLPDEPKLEPRYCQYCGRDLQNVNVNGHFGGCPLYKESPHETN